MSQVRQSCLTCIASLLESLGKIAVTAQKVTSPNTQNRIYCVCKLRHESELNSSHHDLCIRYVSLNAESHPHSMMQLLSAF